jgi:hypothetical protein
MLPDGGDAPLPGVRRTATEPRRSAESGLSRPDPGRGAVVARKAGSFNNMVSAFLSYRSLHQQSHEYEHKGQHGKRPRELVRLCVGLHLQFRSIGGGTNHSPRAT